MSRPVPLAIVAFLLGALMVVMIIAQRYYTIEDLLFRNPEYAENIITKAAVVPNTAIELQVHFNAQLPTATSLPPAASDSETASAPTSSEATIRASTDGYSLVVQLQNTGSAAAWGQLECRFGAPGQRLVVAVQDLRPNMAEPAIVVIPLGDIPIPEEGLPVRVRWKRLYVK